MSGLVASDPLPRWSLTRWLIDPGQDVPDAIRISLFNALYGTLPIFLGGVFNTVLVSTAIAMRHPTPLFIGWAIGELLLAIIRLPVVILGLRAIREGRRGPSDLYILLALLWAFSVGFGSFICLLSGDWVIATLACLSAAAMVGGICLRNYAAPRLSAAMIALSLGPCVLGGILSGETVLLVTFLQIPAYLGAMTAATFRMNRMLIERMEAEIDKDRRARHDELTGLLNRTGLAAEFDRRAVAGDAEDLAFLFLDLDGFKGVNDTLGHSAGDRLLVEVAERLRAAARSGDIVVRLGGDEFLLVTRSGDPAGMRSYGETLIRALSLPYLIDGSGVDIGVSIGVALSREHGCAFADLIEAADGALYKAKAQGRNRCVVAQTTPRLAASRRHVAA
ncbi:diguanylate cyclase [Sphingosinicella sp. LHD-64]|uniref:diguanylate cyclase domain-containing protein n=1 Tax=Sphingosinicella sp. LHD-64 TaxID=3072139 RepID=UPI00280EC3CE|nr:diguanylate cyclase [Sphingosinicella sp. LHD-64]MDQ8756956.1 diguanylate cyclase [Sphingosinicella sp. LHD-64]